MIILYVTNLQTNRAKSPIIFRGRRINSYHKYRFNIIYEPHGPPPDELTALFWRLNYNVVFLHTEK